jgi:hypothetical protein
MAAFHEVALSIWLLQIFNSALMIEPAFFDDFFPVWYRDHHAHPSQQHELRCLILPCFTIFWASYTLIGKLIETHTLYFQHLSPHINQEILDIWCARARVSSCQWTNSSRIGGDAVGTCFKRAWPLEPEAVNE